MSEIFVLIYLHGGDLPGWLINLIFFMFSLVPVIIIFSIGFVIYKLVYRAEKKSNNHHENEKNERE